MASLASRGRGLANWRFLVLTPRSGASRHRGLDTRLALLALQPMPAGITG